MSSEKQGRSRAQTPGSARADDIVQAKGNVPNKAPQDLNLPHYPPLSAHYPPAAANESLLKSVGTHTSSMACQARVNGHSKSSMNVSCATDTAKQSCCHHTQHLHTQSRAQLSATHTHTTPQRPLEHNCQESNHRVP